MEQNRRLVVHVEPHTATLLAEKGYGLEIFRAVMTSATALVPVRWAYIDPIDSQIEVSWADAFSVFAIDPGQQERAAESLRMPLEADVALGQTARVYSLARGEVIWEGPADAISIVNAGLTDILCGIQQSGSPFCGITLHPAEQVSITPLDRLILRFTCIDETGGVTTKSSSPAVAVEFRAAHERHVTYDASRGWRWAAHDWTVHVRDANLMQALVVFPSVVT